MVAMLGVFVRGLRLSVLCLIFSAGAALADGDSSGARMFLDDFLANTFAVVDRGMTAPVIAEAEQLLARGIDYQWVGTFVMGNIFSVANAEQKVKLIELYKNYIIYNYFPLLLRYKHAIYNIKSSNSVGNDTFVVSADLHCRGCAGRPANIIYRVRYRGSQYQIYDIIIDGASFLSSQRVAFKNIVGKMSSVEDVISRLDKEDNRLRQALTVR